MLTRISTRKLFTHLWSHHLVSDHIPYSGNMDGSQGVLIHAGVHGGKDVGGRRRRQSPQQRRLNTVLQSARCVSVSQLTSTYSEIIAKTSCDLGQSVCIARCHQDDICPASQLWKGQGRQRRALPRRRLSLTSMCKIGSPICFHDCFLYLVSTNALRHFRPCTDAPLLIVSPYLGAALADALYVFGSEEVQRCFRCDDLHFNAVVLRLMIEI
jgi:hypothetical protein